MKESQKKRNTCFKNKTCNSKLQKAKRNLNIDVTNIEQKDMNEQNKNLEKRERERKTE